MNSSEQQEFANQTSLTFRKVCRSGGVSKLVNWRVFHVIHPIHTPPTIYSDAGEVEFFTTDLQLAHKGLALPDIPMLKMRFFLWEKLRKYTSRNRSIRWLLDKFSDKEVLDLDKRITKVDTHFAHKNFSKNLTEDIEDWLSFGEIIVNASQIQQLEYFQKTWKFWFDDGDILTRVQKLQLWYTAARMKERLFVVSSTPPSLGVWGS